LLYNEAQNEVVFVKYLEDDGSGAAKQEEATG
jgi:hypothetical protein